MNYLVERATKGITKECSYLPTRKKAIKGQLVRPREGGPMVFISHDYKVVLKVKEQMNICSCLFTYKTNYEGLYLRYLTDCNALDAKVLPPAAINVEKERFQKYLLTIFYLSTHNTRGKCPDQVQYQTFNSYSAILFIGTKFRIKLAVTKTY